METIRGVGHQKQGLGDVGETVQESAPRLFGLIGLSLAVTTEYR
jgi:hypothetical protein